MYHVTKSNFKAPFVCGCRNLGEALRRITEGAAMIRSKGEAGTGDVSNATTHMRKIRAEIKRLQNLPQDELFVAAKELQAPYELVAEVAERFIPRPLRRTVRPAVVAHAVVAGFLGLELLRDLRGDGAGTADVLADLERVGRLTGSGS